MKKIALPSIVAVMAIILIGQSFYIYRLAKKVNNSQAVIRNTENTSSAHQQKVWRRGFPQAQPPINIFSQTWDPFAEMDQMRREMDQLFRNTFQYGSGFSLGAGHDLLTHQMNMSENDNAYILKVELPGIGAEDVRVETKNGILNIYAENKSQKDEKKKGYQSYYRSSSVFSRSFPLPEDANNKDIKAKIEKGVLQITIPKLLETQNSPINIPIV